MKNSEWNFFPSLKWTVEVGKTSVCLRVFWERWESLNWILCDYEDNYMKIHVIVTGQYTQCGNLILTSIVITPNMVLMFSY